MQFQPSSQSTFLLKSILSKQKQNPDKMLMTVLFLHSTLLAQWWLQQRLLMGSPSLVMSMISTAASLASVLSAKHRGTACSTGKAPFASLGCC